MEVGPVVLMPDLSNFNRLEDDFCIHYPGRSAHINVVLSFSNRVRVA